MISVEEAIIRRDNTLARFEEERMTLHKYLNTHKVPDVVRDAIKEKIIHMNDVSRELIERYDELITELLTDQK